MSVKTIAIESRLDSQFKIESTIRGHQIIVDQPSNAGGKDTGPTPLEYLLVSLAGCVGTISRIVAMQKKINLRDMVIKVEGDINTDGLLGKPTDDSVGFKAIRVIVDMDADLSAEEKSLFIHEVDRRCPVSVNLTGVTPVTIS
jgi:putative redox protein